jgi:hypothetical protein
MAVRTGAVEQAQMLKYLRSSGKTVGLLLNFGLPSLEYRRFVLEERVVIRPAIESGCGDAK